MYTRYMRNMVSPSYQPASGVHSPFKRRHELTRAANAGPIVRIGPQAVDVSDPTAARVVHAARSGFVKDPSFYVGGRVSSLFATTDPSFHADRRRLLGPCFAESSMNSLEPAVFARAKLAVEKIGQDLEMAGRADILKWWTLFAMDVISELCYGESFRMLDAGKVGPLHRRLFLEIDPRQNTSADIS